MNSLFLVLIILYVLFVVILWFAWKKIPTKEITLKQNNAFVSVLVAVKNEEQNIQQLLNDFNQQTYFHFEVIVINDASTDNTLKILNNFKPSFSLKIIDLKAAEKEVLYKKGALLAGLKKAKGELIMTTDGDCRVGKNWVKIYADFYKEKDAKFIAGPVTFYQEKTLFERIQTIEFSSLIGSGASFLGLGYPNMCNGANLAYQKKMIEELNAYEGNEQIASGDDEFLMHKIFEKYPKDVHFLKSKKAIVQTKGHTSLKNFYYQRKRWASKWNQYQFNYITILAVGVLLFNFLLSIGFVLAIFDLVSYSYLLLGFSVRMAIDYLYLLDINKFLGKKIKYLDFLILSVVYMYYVAFFGIIVNITTKYQWKNQTISK